jgi:folate-dependent phosphoribosylglycinamide formyltransferase PurN
MPQLVRRKVTYSYNALDVRPSLLPDFKSQNHRANRNSMHYADKLKVVLYLSGSTVITVKSGDYDGPGM